MLSKTISRHYLQSSSFKMAVLFTALLGFSAMMLGYYLLDFTQQNLIRETEAAIQSEMKHLTAAVKGQSAQVMAETINRSAAQTQDVLYTFMQADGTILAGHLISHPENVETLKEGLIQFHTSINGEPERLVAAKIHTFANGHRVMIARDIGAVVSSYRTLQWVSGLILFFMLVVVSVSFFISAFVVNRINRIAHTAGRIMETGDLSQRIEIDGRWDDLSYLASILNQLFARMEQLMEGIRDVSDSIAHDLRTPLTRLRNRLEGAKEAPLNAPDMDMLIQEADQLLAIFHSLMRIANIEKGKRHTAFSDVRLHDVLADVIELYEPLAEEKQIQMIADVATLAAITGDQDLLFQVFANLLDNAVKFSPVDSKITVTLSQQANRQHVVIADEGAGIQPQEREKVFDRFYRGDKSRHTEGTGLGLSLVKAILSLHHAEILLHDNHPGLRVEVILPT